jgi:putative DNA primase/helicase
VDDDTEDGNAAELLDLPDTVTAITGGGGKHFSFLCPASGLRNSVSKIADGIDIRADGGCVLLPGSIHPETGEEYRWAPGRSPDEIPLAPLPDRIVAQLAMEDGSRGNKGANGRSHGTGDILADKADEVRRASEGTRNHTLNRVAYFLGGLIRAGTLSRADVERELRSAALDAGLEQTEIEATLRSGLDDGEEKGPMPRQENRASRATRCFKLTDTGNAERFVARFGDRFRYCHPWKKALIWTGKRWQIDDSGQALTLTKTVARGIWAEAQRARNDSERDDILKWARASEKLDRRRAMVALAAVEQDMPIGVAVLDRHPLLLNVLNGTLDLQTGELRQHCREDYLTKLVRQEYHPDATCPRWLRFLEEVFPDPEVRAFMQRAIG